MYSYLYINNRWWTDVTDIIQDAFTELSKSMGQDAHVRDTYVELEIKDGDARHLS